MRKQDSTNARNEASILRNCGMAYALNVIGGRWKPTILFSLLEGKMRYNELRKTIPGVSERMLVAQLRELEEHGLVRRNVFPEVPPRVEYELTELGHSTEPMLQCMSDWGNMHRKKEQVIAVQ
ncbi:winged helix-turn-helix transcriptional regulator [Chitinophaga barathri]|uniref:Transcriptional regulator n=1 Tax=Chitinophaga barathri TaxID=1647451 RepID=A0A3N4MDE1_9BACT|nr:helix-turn-helix domain-containing protein [Chitinophaga barathri]RPD38100.1 transcriptional regulator [Chitinophaga barathri]